MPVYCAAESLGQCICQNFDIGLITDTSSKQLQAECRKEGENKYTWSLLRTQDCPDSVGYRGSLHWHADGCGGNMEVEEKKYAKGQGLIYTPFYQNQPAID